jgi:PadR family transcriptional regulator, regulatory protein AphA
MEHRFDTVEHSVPKSDLSLFSYEILGLVGQGGAGPHELRRMVQRNGLLDWAGESQYYVEPKRLYSLGYLTARIEPGKTRARTVYTLTEKGIRALREYAATPAELTPFKSDALVRLLIADLVGEAPTRESIAALRSEIEELSARLDESEASAEALPHRRKYLVLVIEFLRGLLKLHTGLVEKVEQELAAPSETPAPSASAS